MVRRSKNESRKQARLKRKRKRWSRVETLESRKLLASDIEVSTLRDELDNDHSIGDLSLREALLLASQNPGADTIRFKSSLFGTGNSSLLLGDANGSGSIDGSEMASPLLIGTEVSIIGPGSGHLTLDGGGLSRVLEVTSSADAVISGLSITGGFFAGHGGGVYLSGGALELVEVDIHGNVASGNSGGGVYNHNGNLTVRASTIRGNTAYRGAGLASTSGHTLIADSLVHDNSTSSAATASRGGGLLAYGFGGPSHTFTTLNTTISGNQAGHGGGLSVTGTLRVDVIGSTITSNTALGIGATGGLLTTDSDGSGVTLHNTILADNSSIASAYLNSRGPANSSSSYNLIGPGSGAFSATNGNQVGVSDPGLLPLDDYGGPTHTHAIAHDSPAIDAGNDAWTMAATSDQRGFDRIVGSKIDIGAVEFLTWDVPYTSRARSLTHSLERVGTSASLSFDEIIDSTIFRDRLRGKSAISSGQSPPALIAGEYGNAIRLVDPDQSVSIRSSPQMNLLGANDSDFSLSFHLRPEPNATDELRPILAKATSLSDHSPAIFLVGSTNRLRVQVSTSTGLESVESDMGLIPNQWHHIGVVKKASQLTIFIDGQARGAIELSGPTLGNQADLKIGSFLDHPSSPFGIDELQVFNDSISEEALRFLSGRPASGLVRAQGSFLAIERGFPGVNFQIEVVDPPSSAEVVTDSAATFQYFDIQTGFSPDRFLFEMTNGFGERSVAAVTLRSWEPQLLVSSGPRISTALDWSIQLPFDGDSSGVILDVDGVEPMQTFPSTGVARVPGKNGNAFRFYSNAEGLIIEDDDANEIGVRNQDFSAAMWVRPDGNPTNYYRPLMLKGDLDGARLPAVWLTPNANRVRVQVTNHQGTIYSVDTIASLAPNAWSHIAVVKTEDEIEVYVNGVLDSTIPFAGETEANSSPLHLGRFPGRQSSVATFDDVSLLPRAMTAFEVAQLYTATSTTLASATGVVYSRTSRSTLPNSFTLEEGPEIGAMELLPDGTYYYFGDPSDRSSTTFSYVVSNGIQSVQKTARLVLGGSSSLQVGPIGDAAILSSHPHDNLGSLGRLDTRQLNGTTQNGLLQFDISRFDYQADHFYLKLDLFSGPVTDTTPDSHSLYRVSSDWEESIVTYNNAPPLNQRIGSWTPRTDSEITIDVTETVVAAILAGETKVAFAIQSDTEGYFRYHSSESTAVAKRPRLVVEADWRTPTIYRRPLEMDEDTTLVLGLSDFAINNFAVGSTEVTIQRQRKGQLTLDGFPVVTGQKIDAGDIFAGNLSFTPDTDLFGLNAAEIEYTVDGLGDPIFDSQIRFDVLPTPDAPSLFEPHNIINYEDEVYTFDWSDFDIGDPDADKPDVIRLASMPIHGDMLRNGLKVTNPSNFSREEFLSGKIKYHPKEGTLGLGVESLDWRLMDFEASAFPMKTMHFETVDVATLGEVSVRLHHQDGTSVLSAEVGEIVTASVILKQPIEAMMGRGGYLDLAYESDKLELVEGSIRIETNNSVSDSYESESIYYQVEPGRIRNLVAISASQGDGYERTLATLDFEITAPGTTSVMTTRPTTDSFEPFLDRDGYAYQHGEVDYYHATFSSNLVSASTGPGDDINDPGETPFSLVAFVDEAAPWDSTSGEATEPHAVLLDVKDRVEEGSGDSRDTCDSGGDEGGGGQSVDCDEEADLDHDLIYYRAEVVPNELGLAAVNAGASYLKVEGAPETLYQVYGGRLDELSLLDRVDPGLVSNAEPNTSYFAMKPVVDDSLGPNGEGLPAFTWVAIGRNADRVEAESNNTSLRVRCRFADGFASN